jgi:hypothetical protein
MQSLEFSLVSGGDAGIVIAFIVKSGVPSLSWLDTPVLRLRV